MDIIFLRGLAIETVIGIYDWEREIRQTLIIDLEMATDIRKAAETDDITHTLDYKAVSRRIIDFVEGSSFQLVETLAERITEILINEFQVPWVRLTLNKRGAISGASDVGIRIERGTQPG
jgi:dihydroneopterin aldolase